jgi:hypothetical protein
MLKADIRPWKEALSEIAYGVLFSLQACGFSRVFHCGKRFLEVVSSFSFSWPLGVFVHSGSYGVLNSGGKRQ